ncbi:MAG: serine hydrolase [Verrucomicrobia bacterium]|nr:serine hydrolase [Verrucomicrobiota bacterium]
MKKIKILLIAIALVFITLNGYASGPSGSLPFAKPESVGMSSDRLTRIDHILQQHIDKGDFSGAVSLVSRHGKIVHFKSFGLRDIEANQPMEKNTLVRIYSMTKPIVSAALMMLHEEGKFQLNDPVTKYIPQFKDLKVLEDGYEVDPVRPMRIQHLFTHTAGFTYGFFGDSVIDKRYLEAGILRTQATTKEFIEELAKIPLQTHPGERYHYSVAVDVQGYLVEVLSGMPLDQFLQQHIFDPLGMQDTFFEVPDDKEHRFAANYNYNREKKKMELRDAPHTSKFVKEVTFFSGGGGLVSTAEDYWRFCQMMLNEGVFNGQRLLGRKTVELMRSDHLPAALADHDPHSNFGFGLGFRVIKNVPLTGAPGSIGDYSWGGAAGTIFWIDPEEDLVAVTMIQLRQSPYNLRREMHSLIYQAIVD